MSDILDCIIIGGGPAGLSSAIYALRGGMSTVIIEKMLPGGQAAYADLIENYPGFPNGISGAELSANMQAQAENLGAQIVYDTATDAKKVGDHFVVTTSFSGEYTAKSIILALGAYPKMTGIPAEPKYQNKGISYCAVCDGALFKDKIVTVIGGGNTAVGDAIYLSRFVKMVYIVHRRDELRATKVLQERANANPKITICYNSVPCDIIGEDRVQGLVIKDVQTEELSTLECEGIFVAVGQSPDTAFVKSLVNINEYGYIITDYRMATNVEGIFAVGDAVHKELRQVITAAADGAVAATAMIDYINNL